MWDTLRKAFEFEDGMSRQLRCLNLGPTDFQMCKGDCWVDNGPYMSVGKVYKLKPIDPVAWLRRNRTCSFKDAPPSVRGLDYSFTVITTHRGFQFICDLTNEDIPFLPKPLPHMPECSLMDCLQYSVRIYLDAKGLYRFHWNTLRLCASAAPSIKGFVCYTDAVGNKYDTFNEKCIWIILKGVAQ